MIEIRRILCPVDFSECSRRSADHAMAIARWYGASVTALHVYPMPPVAAAPAGPIILEPLLLTAHQRTELLAATRQSLAAAAPGVVTDAVLREGGAAAGILEHAREADVDLIVMGTHGRSGVDGGGRRRRRSMLPSRTGACIAFSTSRPSRPSSSRGTTGRRSDCRRERCRVRWPRPVRQSPAATMCPPCPSASPCHRSCSR